MRVVVAASSEILSAGRTLKRISCSIVHPLMLEQIYFRFIVLWAFVAKPRAFVAVVRHVILKVRHV